MLKRTLLTLFASVMLGAAAAPSAALAQFGPPPGPPPALAGPPPGLVHIQAIRHQTRSGVSWKLIEADGPLTLLAERNLPIRAAFGIDN
jgi:hypothetical protein